MANITTIRSLEIKKKKIVEEKERINEKALQRYKQLLKESTKKSNIDQIRADHESAEKMETRMEEIDDHDGLALERIIYQNDLFPISYLQSGFNVAHSVCRITLSDRVGRIIGYGTGFLISPSLLMTNNHVLDKRETALYSIAEFNYQNDENNMPCQSVSFRLDPDTLFITDEMLDFTIVSIIESTGDKRRLTDFGYLKLLPKTENIVEKEYVSIIQHPKGGPKAVTVRENEVKFLMDDFIHYLTDTEPGSSGSPVFNDQWVVVALHHSGVPDPEDRNNWIANEGVRISSILAHLYNQRSKFDPKDKALIDKILELDEIIPATKDPKIGDLDKKWYGELSGYNPSFLGVDVPLPSLDECKKEDITLTYDGKMVLDYTNFSTVMSKSRKIAFYTAINIDGENHVKINHTNDRWFFDKRIGEQYQCGNDLYINNKLDRGHLVRRLNPNWSKDAEKANDAIFHFTNCSPQHENLNQKAWLNLEDYVLNEAKKYGIRVNVFTGPIFSASDMVYRGIKIPAEFWKVAVMIKQDGPLSATAYLQTQKNLIENLEFAYGEYKTYQVPMEQIEDLTGLDFGDLRNYDSLKKTESLYDSVAGFEIEKPEDIRF